MEKVVWNLSLAALKADSFSEPGSSQIFQISAESGFESYN